MESTPLYFGPRPRLMRSTNDPHKEHFRILFQKGVMRWCTCGNEECDYNKCRSEGCQFGGDAGEEYMQYCNNQSLGLA